MAEPGQSAGHDRPEPVRHTASGPGRLLVGVYALFALAATGRAVLQISEYFSRAPLSYVLTALASVIYIVATVALSRGGPAAIRVATWSCSIELVGVLLVGTASYAVPSAFPDSTVWSQFGQGYGYVPLVLPILGLWWLSRHRQPRSPA